LPILKSLALHSEGIQAVCWSWTSQKVQMTEKVLSKFSRPNPGNNLPFADFILMSLHSSQIEQWASYQISVTSRPPVFAQCVLYCNVNCIYICVLHLSSDYVILLTFITNYSYYHLQFKNQILKNFANFLTSTVAFSLYFYHSYGPFKIILKGIEFFHIFLLLFLILALS